MRLYVFVILFWMMSSCSTFITDVKEVENGLMVTHKRNYEKQQTLIDGYASDKCGVSGFTKFTERKVGTRVYRGYETIPAGGSVYHGRVSRYGYSGVDVDMYERRHVTVPVEREYQIDWYETTCICKDRKSWMMPQEKKHVSVYSDGCLGGKADLRSCRKLIDTILGVYELYYLDIPDEEVKLLMSAYSKGCELDSDICRELRSFKDALESKKIKLKGLSK